MFPGAVVAHPLSVRACEAGWMSDAPPAAGLPLEDSPSLASPPAPTPPSTPPSAPPPTPPSAPRVPPAPRRQGRKGVGHVLDLVLAAALAAAAALLAGALPDGDGRRAMATLAILLVVPGYLLVEAAVPSTARGQRALHALVGVGVSLPLVGLLALATAIVPGGFRASMVIASVTLACLALAVVAALRRLRSSAPAAPAAPIDAAPVPQP